MADTIASSVGYAISQQKRKLIEQGFGWAKTVGRMRQAMVRGLKKVDQMFVLNMAAYNLVRLRSLAQVRPVTIESRSTGETSLRPQRRDILPCVPFTARNQKIACDSVLPRLEERA